MHLFLDFVVGDFCCTSRCYIAEFAALLDLVPAASHPDRAEIGYSVKHQHK